MTMRRLAGKMPGFVAGVVILGNLPLLAFIVLFLQLMATRATGHASGGDGLGLAIMAVLAYGLALLSFSIGAGYFGYQRLRHQQLPQAWHAAILAWCLIELVAPPLYFTLT